LIIYKSAAAAQRKADFLNTAKRLNSNDNEHTIAFAKR
jgi:hypothetical protein